MRAALAPWLDGVTHQLFGTRCWGCARLTSAPLCEDCRRRYPLEGPCCDGCGTPTSGAIASCGRCRARQRNRRPDSFARARSAYWLDPVAHSLLHQLKHLPRPQLLRVFRPWVNAESLADLPVDAPLVALPAHFDRHFRRGFNFPDLLVDWLTALSARPHASGELVKIRSTAPQSTLGARARDRNVRGTFEWRGNLPSAVILVDDVFTTGSTLNAAAHCVRHAGCGAVYAWTLFRAPARASASATHAAPH